MKWEKINKTVWDKLKETKKPIILYGMGDGAQKILKVFEKKNIKASGIFASDEFVRGHQFLDFKVKTLRQITDEFGEDIFIVLSFASQREELLKKFCELNNKYDFVAPDVPVIGEGLFDLDFVKKHKEKIEKVFEILKDERSKQVFENIICFKLTGNINYLLESQNSKDDVFKNILNLRKNEKFVDLGAYNGDTIREFLNYTNGEYNNIIAFEPDKKTFKKLEKYVHENLSGKVNILNAGVWENDCEMIFAQKAGRNSKIEKEGIKINMRSVDSVLNGESCTFIKFDVEGAEKQAIDGAKQTILKFKPKLNIACYHRNEDLFSIPLQINSICKDYKIYIRHHPYVPAWDVNLYAK